MTKTALIMAAGLGTRFGKMTETMPKGFVEVGGMSMVERSIETLIACGIERILIGTGYKHEKYDEFKSKYPQIETCFSPRYAETNSMYTLWNMRELVGGDDFLLLESDLVFEKKAITSLLETVWDDVLLITPVTKFQDQYYVESDDNDVLTNCSVNKEEVNAMGEFVGIHKISNRFFKLMCEDYGKKKEVHPKLGYEYELLFMSKNISQMHVLNVPNLLWYEIDDVNDMEFAEKNILSKI